MSLSKEVKRQIKGWALNHAIGRKRYDAPIVLVDGKQAPVWIGQSYYWETKGGQRIYYPNAYRRAWGKPVYVPSTCSIEVGREWVKRLEKDLLHVQLSKKYGRLVHRRLVEFCYSFISSSF